MELEELIQQYNPRAAVPDHEVWKAHWGLDSERVRASLQGHLRVPYGDTPGQCMDVFPAKEPGAPVQIESWEVALPFKFILWENPKLFFL